MVRCVVQGWADQRDVPWPRAHASSDITTMQRRLRADSNVTVVNTEEELLEAVARGDSHIELQSHLNLVNYAFTVDSLSQFKFLLGFIPPTVESIRVCGLLRLQ